MKMFTTAKLPPAHICNNSNNTRSTGTVHTSAKARLTSITIRIRIRNLDRHQNLITCSLAHYQPFRKISCKSVFAQSC